MDAKETGKVAVVKREGDLCLRSFEPSVFRIGRIIVSEGVEDAVHEHDWHNAVCKHAACDWGHVSTAEWHRNEDAIGRERRVRSIHVADCELVLVIVTAGDRLTTRICLNCEY